MTNEQIKAVTDIVVALTQTKECGVINVDEVIKKVSDAIKEASKVEVTAY